MIWINPDISVSQLNAFRQDNMGGHLGIRFTAIDENSLTAEMPVDERTKQPYGLLHGGASCVLAETLGSVASALVVNLEEKNCVGLEINANHIRSVRSGKVIGKVTPIHLGSSTHVWDIRIEDEEARLVCVSRLTVAILSKNRSETPK